MVSHGGPLHRRPPRPVWAAASVVVLLAAALILPAPVRAQPVSGGLLRIQSIEPGWGPVGTEIQVFTENLPYQAAVHVGLGGTRSGWEALARARQDGLGAVSAVVEVPGYAPWDKAQVVIIFDASFSPIAISDPFHVTDGRGRVRRSGRLARVREGCVVLVDDDGYGYALGGAVDPWQPGDAVVVEGTYHRPADGCGDAGAIRVERVSGPGGS